MTQTSTQQDVLGHSTLDPAGTQTMVPARLSFTTPNTASQMLGPLRGTTGTAAYAGPVRVLIRAPFQYKYSTKSYWVTTGEWYSLDPIKDKEEILYLDSPSNPYREFIYMEGHTSVGTSEERGDAYVYGSPYQKRDTEPSTPILSNALLPSEEPSENPHILETLAKAGLVADRVHDSGSLSTPPTTRPILEEEVISPFPAEEAMLPLQGEPVELEAASSAVIVEGTEPSLPIPTAKEMREEELRSMKVPALRALAITLGMEYKDKESTIKQILEADS